MTIPLQIRCAACDTRFATRESGRHTCPTCGHVMLRRKHQTARTLATAASRAPSKTRPAPSLPRVTILED